MVAYREIPDTEIDQDSPVTVTLMTALRDNLLSAFEGQSFDLGAPGLASEAREPITAGSVTRYRDDTVQDNATSTYETVFTYVYAQQGTVRISFRHREQGGSNSEARILKDGAVIGSWSTSSSSLQTRTVDTDIAYGAIVQIQHRIAASTGSNFSQLRDVRILTDGQQLWPSLGEFMVVT